MAIPEQPLENEPAPTTMTMTADEPSPPAKEKPSSEKKKPKKKSKDKSTEDCNALEFTWICTECHEAECVASPEAPLLLCDGKCNRPFHPPCANLATLPPEDEPWRCSDCLQNRHQCAVCKEYGTDDADVFCCDSKGCGLFFHESCLSMYDVQVQIVEVEVPADEDEHAAKEDAGSDGAEESKEDGGKAEERPVEIVTTKTVSRPKFRCPAHKCWTCEGDIPPNPAMMIGGDPTKDICLPVASSPNNGKNKGKKKGKKSAVSGSGALKAMWGAKKERLFRCLECPISYHITCMPPSCRFHELAMLCHEHAYTSKLPYLDVEYSFQAEVEKDTERRIEGMRKRDQKASEEKAGWELLNGDDDEAELEEEEEQNSFLPGLVGAMNTVEEDQMAEYLHNEEEKTAEEDDDEGDATPATRKRKRRRKPHQFNYCLPVDFKEEVYNKPPSYTHINANRYNSQNRPKRHPPTGESCNCKPITKDDDKDKDAVAKPCGDRCLNRHSYIECVGDRSLKSGDKNPYWNCNCGPQCGNRAMAKRQFAKCRPQREHGKGWGLVALGGVKKGNLVQEYAGEIIDEKTKEERLKSWATDHPNDPNFYVMRLEPGWYIDAREVANMARFINHSCDPNCRLVPVNVAGYMRVAIVCVKDVPPGGFLSYDYQFDEKFVCRCGAANCRGTMKAGQGKAGEDADGSPKKKKTKAQLLKEAKERLARDKKFLKSVVDTEKERLYLTGPFPPGSDAEAAEMVAAGPNAQRYRDEALEGRIFLWRNARAGSDFSSRYWKTAAREKGERRRMSCDNLISECQKLGVVDIISAIQMAEKDAQAP